jgi:hypothetical protein
MAPTIRIAMLPVGGKSSVGKGLQARQSGARVADLLKSAQFVALRGSNAAASAILAR